jgi:hypothetical protein
VDFPAPSTPSITKSFILSVEFIRYKCNNHEAKMKMNVSFNMAIIPCLLYWFLGTHPPTPSLLPKRRGVTIYISVTSRITYCLTEGQERFKKKNEII